MNFLDPREPLPLVVAFAFWLVILVLVIVGAGTVMGWLFQWATA